MSDLKLNVVGARRYSFNDRETGRLVQGVNVYYLGSPENGEDTCGVIPAKVTLPYETFNKISSFPFPSICIAKTAQVLTAKGVKTNVVDLEFGEKIGK